MPANPFSSDLDAVRPVNDDPEFSNPDWPAYTLTDRELASLIRNEFGVTIGGVEVPGSIPGLTTATIGQQAVAFALVRAESGGQINAQRPEAKNRLGGIDRGIWQFNTDAHPNLSDADAFNPFVATQRAFVVSKQGRDFGAWAYGPNSFRDGVSRTDLDVAGAARVLAAVEASERGFLTRSEIRKRVDEIGFDTVNANVENRTFVDDLGGFGALLGPAAKVLMALGSGDWWRRIGIAVLGALIVLAAIMLGNSGKLAGLSPASALIK